MKKGLILLTFVITSFLAYSQNFNTGDSGFDSDLSSVNIKAKADFGNFKIELSNNNKAAKPSKIDYMRNDLKMEPAEIFLAFEIARIKGISIDVVIGSWKKNKHKGWGHIAKEMGIKPGSPEFHAMKGNAKNKANHGKGKGNSKGGNNKGDVNINIKIDNKNNDKGNKGKGKH